MNVSLTPRLEALIRGKVASGLYTSASEVVREALRLLEERDGLRTAKLAALRSDIALGLEQLSADEGAPLDIESLKAEGRQSVARQRAAQG